MSHELANDTTMPDALRLVSVSKVYGTGASSVTALDGVTVSMAAGSFTAVMGPSGSGKSTFLHCAAGLDQPTRGRVFVAGAELMGSETALTKFRRQRIGFVFQQFNLLPTLTVLQNVTLPLRLAGRKVDHRHTLAVVDRVGLSDRLDHRPAELSGGQQQRTAIARALVMSPSVIFADEPTGSLDTRSGRDVLRLLRESVDDSGQTVVLVTHDPVAVSYADSVMFLADGQLVGALADPTAEAVAERMTHVGDEAASRARAVGE